MPSPFPGMNPYLEQPDLWRGFHNSFLVHLAGTITPHVVPAYYVEPEESIYIDRPGARQSVRRGRRGGRRRGVRHPRKQASGPAARAPITATVPIAEGYGDSGAG